jgi:beta-ribofuranosylaminobenzene 5'-phosphate synthase
MIQIRAYSRLHFGFLNPCGEGMTAFRCFGGVGLMIAHPDLSVRMEPDSTWSAQGPEAERALAMAQRFASACRQHENISDLPPHRLWIERIMPAHAGLGSGSQLGLSVARALAASWGLSCDVATLALRVGRGLRSALGTYGFEHGGFLVESGKTSEQKLAPLVARQAFPETWRLVVALPPHPNPPPQGGRELLSPSPLVGEGWGGGGAGLHGGGEREAFARLSAGGTGVSPVNRTETLCRLALLGLLPALVERDVDAFGEALFEFNARVGEAFALVQGGVYASPRVAELVEFVRAQRIRGVGQSSWGPAVFAVVADAERAEHLADQLRRRFALPPSAVWTTPACNHGAKLEEKANHGLHG